MSATRVPLSLRLDFGAAGDGITDDLEPLRAAAASGRHVLIEPGVYRVTRPSTSILRLTSGTTLQGAGRDVTVIRLADWQDGSTYRLLDSTAGVTSDCAIRDLTIDGNRHNQSDRHEQGQGIWLEGTARWVLERLTLRDCRADGFYVYNGNTSIVVRDVLSEGHGRDGAVVNATVHGLTIVNSTFRDCAQRAFGAEVFKTGTDRVLIDGCDFQGRPGLAPVTLGGQSNVAPPERHITFSNNTVTGGGVNTTRCSNLLIARNRIDASGTRPCIAVRRESQNVVIADNILHHSGAPNLSHGIVAVAAASQEQPRSVTIRDNHMVSEQPTRGVFATGVERLMVSGNVMSGSIYLRSTRHVRSARVCGNTLVGPPYAWLRADQSPAPFDVLMVTGNLVACEDGPVVDAAVGGDVGSVMFRGNIIEGA